VHVAVGLDLSQLLECLVGQLLIGLPTEVGLEGEGLLGGVGREAGDDGSWRSVGTRACVTRAGVEQQRQLADGLLELGVDLPVSLLSMAKVAAPPISTETATTSATTVRTSRDVSEAKKRPHQPAGLST
jgi:hypothetical protein